MCPNYLSSVSYTTYAWAYSLLLTLSSPRNLLALYTPRKYSQYRGGINWSYNVINAQFGKNVISLF